MPDTEVLRCPVCASAGDALYTNLPDRRRPSDGRWSMRRCRTCHTLWLTPRPDDEGLDDLYDDYVTLGPHAKDASSERVGTASGRLVRALFPRQARERQRYAHMLLGDVAPGRLLDVGCSDGAFLAHMRQRGWDVLGVDVDPAAIAVARERHGVQVVEGPLDRAGLADGAFDAITLSHVIEHVADPSDFLRECARLLRPGGRLALTTPNPSSLAHRAFGQRWLPLDTPRHLVLMPPTALASVFEGAGLRVLSLETPTRTAGMVIRRSQQIRATGAVGPMSGARQNASLALERRALVVLEMTLVAFGARVGEEIGVLAARDG